MNVFDAATAVTRKAPGRFDATLDPAWTIGPDRPNGGYLLAVLGRAALEEAAAAGADHPHPLAANVQYVSSPSVGPVEVHVEVLRAGRFASQVRARMVQGGSTCVDALLTLGRLSPDAAPWWGEVPAVELPPEDECARLPRLTPPTDGPSFRDVVDERFDPRVLGFLDGAPTGEGELRAWFRFADGRDADPLSLLFVADAMPPATFTLVAAGWVPTLDLTVYVRAVPAPGPLRMRFRVGTVQDGVVDEVCEIWDSGGRLVAQSTQLAAIRVPAG